MSAAIPQIAVGLRFAACVLLLANFPAALLGAQAASAAALPADPSATTDSGGIVTLSPFTITTSTEKGYLATQTLNGTRINTQLRDVGAAMTIFTEQILDDLAANSVNDVASYAPNTDLFVGNLTDTTGNGNAFLTTATPQYVTRGGATALISQDFLTSNIPPDRYSSENFTFTRGPNAILFGLGNPAGAFASTSKRARFKNAYSLELRGDDHGGTRAVMDLNRVIVPRKLALRFAGLHEDAEGFRDPSGNQQRRQYLTALYTPFRPTSIRVNYEMGRFTTLAIRPWPIYDGVSPWIDAGRPMLALAGGGRTPPAGIQNAYANTTQGVVVTDHSQAGTVVAPMFWVNQGRSANPTYPGYPNVSTLRSLNRSDIFPVEANLIGDGSARDGNFQNLTAVWEQQIGANFFVEATFNRAHVETMVGASFNGNSDRLYVDVNRQLPNGAPNPNAGMLYADSFANVLPNQFGSTSKRLTMSYDLDLPKRWPSRGAWLGRHRLAAFLEDSNSAVQQSNNPSQNLTPLPGQPAALTNLANRVIFRYYVDPARGVVAAGFDTTSKYPLIFANTPLPPANPNGVTPGLVAIFGGTVSDTRLITRALASQSSFWNGRLVATFGLRDDTQVTYRATLTDFAPYRDARGIYPNPRLFDAKRHFPKSRLQESGYTYTHGVVFHALSWLSLYYNQSNNLQPNSSLRDAFGRLLPNPEGEGQDYGIKFAFADNRIVGDLTYYKNYSRNRSDGTVASGLHGSFQNNINAIWTTIAARDNKPEYENNPYAYPFSVWQDVNTGYSDGYEASLTANLTPQWRFTVNGSKRGPGETLARGTIMQEYLAKNLALWKGNAAWLAYPLNDTSAGAGTVADAVGRLETTLASFNALAGLPSDSLFAPKWSTNVVTSYTFTTGSRLKGITVGASANVRGPTVIGFAEDARGVLVANRPYQAPEFATIGSWISYRRKIFEKVDWRLQLNVRNLLDENRIFPHRAVDRRDGSGRSDIAIYRLNEPRTFVLTSSFGF